MVEGSGLESLCTISNNFQGIIHNINHLMKKDYYDSFFNNKKVFLEENFTNINSVKKLLEHIYK